MKKHFINFIKILVFFGIGAFLFYLVFDKQNTAFQEECVLQNIAPEDCSLFQKVWNDFMSTNFFWIFMVFFAYTISNVSRMIRWDMLIRPMGYQPRKLNEFCTIMIGYFTNLFFPRAGELARAGVFSKVEKIPVEKVMGTVVVDRIVDVISFAIVLGLAFLLQFEVLRDFTKEQMAKNAGGEEESSLGMILWILLIIGIIGLAVLYFLRDRIKQTGIYQKIQKIVEGFWEGIQTVRKLEKPWLFIFHSLNIWVMYYLMCHFGLLSFEATSELGWLAAVVIFAAGALGIVIPSPGGMGSYHILVMAALFIYGIGGNDAFSITNILFFSINIGCNVVLGVFSFAVLAIYNKNYEPPAVNDAP